MAVITFDHADIGRCYPGSLDESYNVTTTMSGVAGHALYQDPTTGGYGLAKAAASGTAGFRGIALEDFLVSGCISMLRRGHLYGYVLTGMSYDDPVYLSNTEGMLDTAAGDVSVIVGRVVSVNDPSKEKVIYIDAEYASGSDLG